MNLPTEFLERMKQQLGDDYPKFVGSYSKERTYGLRWNPLKSDKTAFETLMYEKGFHLESVDWAEEGYYYLEEEHPGRHPLHEAGYYYIQEPSAMAVVELLAPKPGEWICDLCAAPGGKSTQIAGRMQGQGVLISNELIASRAKILSQNMERMGVRNGIVCNETPIHLSELFAGCFDRVVVDAPCSGEGMFRKDENARGEWSTEQVEICAKRQKEILECAVRLLKPGGVLVYSTCTFSKQENEENTNWLLAQYPDISLEKEVRIMPHLQRGEGHYAARFQFAKSVSDQMDDFDIMIQKSSFKQQAVSRRKKTKVQTNGADLEESLELFWQFAKELVVQDLLDELHVAFDEGRILFFGEQMYLLPRGFFPSMLSEVKVERVGLQLGMCKKKRFEPSHAFAMALSPKQVLRTVSLETLEEAERYLRGETMGIDKKDGWVLVTVWGISIGWGKIVHGILKNHYPKGLRKM